MDRADSAIVLDYLHAKGALQEMGFEIVPQKNHFVVCSTKNDALGNPMWCAKFDAAAELGAFTLGAGAVMLEDNMPKPKIGKKKD